ncbi:MAG: GntR family transcriptional regulator [Armatimonadetes bacterium]|nr:GntR family transcriptional regulator [Armatimonadota bacterium]MDW8029282.1 GntR family transcriptional regulator [Armatimonadota bacterium]
MKVNWVSHVPRFEQVKQIIRQYIQENNLSPGDLLPSEREWARKLRVSQMTVNRAFKELEREVVVTRLIGRGTFVLNANAQPSITLRHHLTFVFRIANIVETLEQNLYYGPVFQGAQSALMELGCSVQFWGFDQMCSLPSEGLTQRAFLFFAPTDDALPNLKSWWEVGVPFVVVGASWHDVELPSVDTDNFNAAVEVVKFLANLGHRRIALIIGNRRVPNNRDRYEGFFAGLRSCSLSVLNEWLIETEFTSTLTESSIQQIREILKSRRRPTAIFAAGYYLAAGTLKIAKELGLKVPEDLSLVAFDDPPSAGYLDPPLTTVRQPLAELGRRGVFKLVALLEGQQMPLSEKLATELIVRASTAPPTKN